MGRCGEIWGDVGICGEMWGDVGSYGERAWRMLLEQLVVRQLLGVGVRRDAVELD